MVAAALADEIETVPAEDATLPHARSRRASAPLVTGERYEIGETIGRGGMGEVCSAYDAQIGREVAIKRIHAEQPSLSQLARFLREARIQGRLQHPAIPPVHELAADARGRPYFVMKKLAGVTLAEVLRDPQAHPGFTRQRLLRAFVDVCQAIELAHENRIVHRDLKPSNVLLGERGEVYVIDWGIAHELDLPDPAKGVTLGTPGYMSPEQQRSDGEIDARADVYALGCVLYEILTGHPLHPRGSVQTPATEVARPTDELPPELEAAYRAATTPDAAARLGSVRELAAAVQRYVDGDRDLERRRVLAEGHVAAAQAALDAPGDDETRRQLAMREAGRALALDPTLHGAAELVGRLMLQPPAVTPKAVTEELAALDLAADRRQLRLVATLSLLNIAWIPALILLGIRDVPYLTAFGIAAVLNSAGQLAALKSDRVLRKGGWLAIVFEMANLVLLARMFTPFLLAPGLAAVSLMSFALSSQARERRVIVTCAVLSIAAVIGTYLAEVAGLVSRTTWSHGDTLMLRCPLDGADRFPGMAAMCLFAVMLIASAASIANAVSRNNHRSREQLQVQSWQLRQLL